MINLNILQLGLAVVIVQGFFQQIICRNTIFTKNEHFIHLQSEIDAKNCNISNKCLHSMINEMIHDEKFIFNIHDIKPQILINTKSIFCTPSTRDFYHTKQIALR